ncbi:hypothetical protein [Streptomyces sp. B6B3]|uniref:hypothetical protein n=1 Tax=Streptomyces sp. B6B3 TaxID=3153570 RepID=UPI00325E1C87
MSPTAVLTEAVQELTRVVASALRGGGDHVAVTPMVAGGDEADPVVLAAARVLGADLLAPRTLAGRAVQAEQLRLADAAARAFPPAAGSATSAWSHWGLVAALRAAGRAGPGAGTGALPGEPDSAWVREETWQRVTGRLANLAALAVPGLSTALSGAAAGRTGDIARGFVRAVRRRDWLQAAGAGRWLATLADVPATLGLDAGLAFVAQMGGEDARVELHVCAAQLMREDADR